MIGYLSEKSALARKDVRQLMEDIFEFVATGTQHEKHSLQRGVSLYSPLPLPYPLGGVRTKNGPDCRPAKTDALEH